MRRAWDGSIQLDTPTSRYVDGMTHGQFFPVYIEHFPSVLPLCPFKFETAEHYDWFEGYKFGRQSVLIELSNRQRDRKHANDNQKS